MPVRRTKPRRQFPAQAPSSEPTPLQPPEDAPSVPSQALLTSANAQAEATPEQPKPQESEAPQQHASPVADAGELAHVAALNAEAVHPTAPLEDNIEALLSQPAPRHETQVWREALASAPSTDTDTEAVALLGDALDAKLPPPMAHTPHTSTSPTPPAIATLAEAPTPSLNPSAATASEHEPDAATTPPPANALNAGERLLQLRAHHGLSVEEAALRLRVPPAQLRALEHNEWGSFPSLRYARALVRSYCRSLGEEADALLRLMPPAEAQPTLHAQPQLSHRELGAKGRHTFWWVAAGVLLLLALLVSLWPEAFMARRHVEVPAAPATATSLPDSDATPGQSSPANQPAAALPNTATVTPTAIATTTPTAPAEAASMPTPVLRLGGKRPHRLSFVVTDRSWIGVQRLDQSKLVDRFVEQDSFDLSITEPVVLVLGNASSTRVLLDGQPLRGLPAPRSNVLRVQLQ